MTYLDNLAKKIDPSRLYIKGLTNKEFAKISSLASHPLPKAYIEFLLTMGKDMSRIDQSHNGFLTGIDVFYNYIPGLKAYAISLLKEDQSDLELSAEDFVFYSSQGCDFAFFKLTEGDNPPVYYYYEGSKQTSFKKVADTFSSFLERYYDQDSSLFQ